MPIRTHRGRAAVYRRLWGWPLRSPRHLVIAVVALAVAATVVGLLLPDPPPSPVSDTSPSRKYETQDPVPTSTTKPSPPSFSVPQAAPPPAAPNPAGLAVVDAWAHQFVTHPPGTSAPQWLDRLRPYTTDEFLAVMADVDPANVPATAVTGTPRAEQSTATSMKVRVPTDAGDIQVLVISTPSNWRVSEYNKVS